MRASVKDSESEQQQAVKPVTLLTKRFLSARLDQKLMMGENRIAKMRKSKDDAAGTELARLGHGGRGAHCVVVRRHGRR